MRTNDRTDFDVVVLGAGISGTLLSIILARHGFSVLMIDGAVHPRFVVGESTIPQTSQLITMLAMEHDVPELNYIGLGTPKLLRKHVTLNCGVKRVFGFAYHRPGQEHIGTEAHQFGNVWRDENHFFRQDIDAYLLATAVRYGAYQVQGVKIEAAETTDTGCSVVAGGTRYTCKFIVDGTGFRSVLADRFGLREQPCTLVSRTRSIFSHMVDVTPFEEIVPALLRNKWSQSTLHHCFARGWIWVIPFNNWEGAPNPLVSVGVTVDDQHHPEDPGKTAEQEFEAFVEMFPTVSRQFTTAKVARPWVRTKRLQYFSTRTVGKRFALLSHAAGFIDPLFSRGLINTVDGIRSLAPPLMAALRDGDFSESRFEHVDLEQKRNIIFADRIVAGSYIAWDDFDLWNAWVRVWGIGVHATESRLGSVILMGDQSKYKPLENPVASVYEEPGYRPFFEKMWDIIQRYDAKQMTVEQARRDLWATIAAYEFSIPLRDGFSHHEWAFAQPNCRDLFLGMPDRHERWKNHLTDPPLEAPHSALPV